MPDDTAPARDRLAATRAAILYTLQLSDTQIKAVAPERFIAALEQDGYTVAAIPAAPDEGLRAALEAVLAYGAEPPEYPGLVLVPKPAIEGLRRAFGEGRLLEWGRELFAAASTPQAVDVAVLAEAFGNVYGGTEFWAQKEAATLAAEYARLTEKQP